MKPSSNDMSGNVITPEDPRIAHTIELQYFHDPLSMDKILLLRGVPEMQEMWGGHVWKEKNQEPVYSKQHCINWVTARIFNFQHQRKKSENEYWYVK